MKRLLAAVLALASLAAIPAARATFHTFVVEEIYSNADGSVQFVVLHENQGFAGQDLFAGHALTSSGAGGTKTFIFPTNLPSGATAGKRVLIATSGFAALGLVAPNYVIPNGFVPLNGGTVDFAGVSSMTYAALPTDGTNALYRGGAVGQNLATNFGGQSVSLSLPPPPAVDLNQHGLTGSWYEPATNGQGFEVEVFPDFVAPGTGAVQVSWFTFDTVVGGPDRQRWYTLSGNVASGQPAASLTIYRNVGGNFNAPPITNGVPVGTATLTFDTCGSGLLTYTFTDGTGRAGAIPLTRITQNVTCSTTAARPTNADFGLSGNWFDAATSGQGFVAEINPNSRAVFVPWYTYAPSGAGAGAAGQRWYTASGDFAPGSRSIAVKIYETTRGAFDMPTVPPPSSVPVGTGTLAFQSCSAATFDYSFTGGSSSGAAGRIALTRVGPLPPGCVF